MMPSPITWFTVPSYRWTASIIRSRTGSRILRASSGSRSASSSIEPLRSAKRTVTCLRSPSSAALEVRIFSARCLGVYDRGEAKAAEPWRGCAWTPVTRAPHFPQNANPSGLAKPHEGHRDASLAPQRPQNAIAGGFRRRTADRSRAELHQLRLHLLQPEAHVKQPQDVQEKILGPSIVAGVEAGRAEVEISRHLE